MRIWLFSDLHQEHDDQPWDPIPEAPADGFDVLVVPGDVHTPLTRSLQWLHERFPGSRVIYVPGNHDYYWDGGEERYTLWDQLDRGRELADRLGIDLLLDSSVEIDGTRFVGGTLWTDFRLDTWSLHSAMREAERDMKDYKKIRRKPEGGKKLRAIETLAMHRATRRYLADELAQPWDGETVVVTHHAPHPNSLANRMDSHGYCYASDLTGLIEQAAPDVWLHGHIHKARDYTIGSTRIVTNPRGHIEETTGFLPGLVVETKLAPAFSPA